MPLRPDSADLRYLGDWSGLLPGDLVGLPREPPIHSSFMIHGGRYDQATLHRDSDGHWQLNAEGALIWREVLVLIFVEPFVQLEVLVPIRPCAREGCEEMVSGRADRKFHHRVCQVAQWRADHPS